MTAKPRASLAELVAGDNSTQQVQVAVGQERFCREIAAGHEYPEAYRRAYGLAPRTQCDAEAYRLARLPHIVARTMQLRTAAISGFSVGRELLLENLLWAVNTARERGSTTEVRKSIEAIGKLFGLIVDKVDANIMGQFTVMKEVVIDGTNLVFDVGSGSPVVIKGEVQEVLQNMQEISGLENETQQNGVKTVANQGDTNTLAALQNASKTLPAQPIALDDLPVEAVLDDIGVEAGTLQIAKRKAKPMPALPDDGMTDEERALLGDF